MRGQYIRTDTSRPRAVSYNDLEHWNTYYGTSITYWLMSANLFRGTSNPSLSPDLEFVLQADLGSLIAFAGYIKFERRNAAFQIANCRSSNRETKVPAVHLVEFADTRN
jgi:hypothetical protein